MTRQRCKHFFQRQPAGQRDQAGFTLIEVLVAATVMALGIIGISLTQPVLNASSDSARLRAEATRLAQQKLDEFRGYQQAAASVDATVLTFDGSIFDGSDQPGAATFIANTIFNRAWAVCARNLQSATCLADNSPAAQFKQVTVSVSWTDRSGVQESVSLSSVIARSDPADLGTLAVGPGKVSVRQPKNRNVDIPYAAVTLPDGIHSAYQPFGVSSPFFQFDNKTGLVKKVCVGNALISGNTIAGDVCQEFASAAYGLSGHVRFCPATGGCDPANPAGKAKRSLQSATTSPAGSPLSFDSSNGVAPAYQACYSGRQVILDNGTVVADADQADNLITARLIAYFCVVQPQAVAGSATPPWSGKVTLNADTTSGWSISAPSGSHKVCRYSADYERTATRHAYCQGKEPATDSLCRMSNNEHPLWYRGVTANLLNQNYLVVAASASCPGGVAPQPLAGSGSFLNAGTALHQSPVAGDTPQFSFTCLSNCASDRQFIEPADVTVPLMTE